MWQNVPEAAQQVATEIADKIQAVENSRHKIIHRMANEYTDDFGDPLPAPYDSVLILRDHPKHFFAERMSVGEITDIASEIAHINARMVNLYFYLWGHVRDP